MTVFDIPDFAVGQGRTFRISASAIASRNSFFACPASTALQSRLAAGSLQPNDASRWRKGWDDASKLHFAIRDGFYRLADGEAIADIVARETALTHAQRRFVRHALEQLKELIPLASDDSATSLHAAPELQAPANLGDLTGDVTLFARHLASADGRTHEVVRMRLKELKPITDEDQDWTAVAALVVLQAEPGQTPQRIRVSDFSLATGDYRVTFDGTPDEARARYASRGQLLPQALSGHDYNPGANCASCGFLNVCPAVPQRRGVLGIPGRAVATRSLSSADLAAYDRCPTAFLAQRRDHLPSAPREDDTDADDTARVRGIAAHALLRWLHTREHHAACTASDLPDPDTDGPAAFSIADAAGIDMDDYRAAHPYLRHHPDTCPLGYAGLGGWLPEDRAVVFDPDADMVVISTPDLTWTVAATEEPVWRETKTANNMPPDLEAALNRYPGFALNVALLAAEAGVEQETHTLS